MSQSNDSFSSAGISEKIGKSKDDEKLTRKLNILSLPLFIRNLHPRAAPFPHIVNATKTKGRWVRWVVVVQIKTIF